MLLRRLALGTLLCFVAAAPARAVDVKYLPGDTEIVISVNFKQMLDSEIAKTHKESIDQVKGLVEAQVQGLPAAKYLEKAGFDLFRDLHGVTIATNGGKELADLVIIIHGNFDAGKVRAAAEDIARDNAEVLKITKIAGREALEITPPGEKRVYAIVLDDKTMVACGSEALAKETIDRSNGGARKGLKDSFKSLLKTTSDKQSFSVVATGGALAKLIAEARVDNADAAAAMISNLEGLSAAITLTKDIQFQLGVSAKDNETAKQAVAMGNFGLLTARTLAAQKAKENPDLQPLVDIAKTLRITADGNNILLRGEVSTENLEKVIKNLPKHLNQ
jgi:hypothetical protein